MKPSNSADPARAARRTLLSALFAAAAGAAACRAPLPPGVEAFTADGRPRSAPPLADAARQAQEQLLAQARDAAAAHPDDRDAAIWVGRRLGYLGRYREAIDVYTAALGRWPGDPFLLRHRGHRWLTVREFGRAIDDLERAAARCRTIADVVEPDGQPVPGRPPHSSLHYNVHYHLGLARFLVGDFDGSERAWLDCLACSDDDESRVAVTHWLWCARMRAGDPAGAAACVNGITEQLDVVENTAYLQLCLFYAGRRTRAQLSAGAGSSGAAMRFGRAHHALVTGDRDTARQQFEALAAEPGWSAFGVVAAEVELQRM